MKALVVRRLGDPTAAADGPIELSSSWPSGGELPSDSVRVRVTAAALNFADALQAQGQYQVKPPLPFVPGAELSGRITAVGSAVRGLSVGDTVCAVTQGGAFAEEAVVSAGAVLRVPPGADAVAAAGLPVAFGTAHLALRERAQLRAGQTLLVLGAAGGVGVAAVQIAKVLGARVVAVARGSAKVAALEQLGADAVIDSSAHPQQPLRAAIKAAAPKGVDVVFDPVGGAHFVEALKCVRWGAHVLFIGFASGGVPKVAANIALVKNLTLHGVFWGSYMAHNPRVLRSGLQELLGWLAAGRIRVPVSHSFPFQQWREAFRVLLSRESIGKVLLLPPDSAAAKL